MKPCPRPGHDCYMCECEALDGRGDAAELLPANADCFCGCSSVVEEYGVGYCVGCGEVAS